MSIKIELNDESIRQQRKNPVKVQYIPASVDEPNKINIDNFFNNYTEEIDGRKHFILSLALMEPPSENPNKVYHFTSFLIF